MKPDTARRLRREKIAKALKTAAREAGVSDVQVAAQIGVSQQTVNRWFTAKTEPSAGQLIEIIGFLPRVGDLLGLALVEAA